MSLCQPRVSFCSISLFASLLISHCLCAPVFAEEAAPKAPVAKSPPSSSPSQAAELAAIRAGSQAFVAAFNQHDAKATAAFWTEEGEYQDESGRKFSGRAAIEQGYANYFAENPHAAMRVMIDSLRLISDTAAVEDGRAVVEPAPPGAPSLSKYTVVHVKANGKWLMASVRDSRVETASAYQKVADLEWLIGDWEAEEHGHKVESVCAWVANKSFVERKYTITQVDGMKLSGVQLIGWNARTGRVQSWDFSPDGGHAIGVWSVRENGWAAEVHGVTGDGAVTSAVNLLTRLDDNAYVWQSVRRTAEDRSLEDTNEVVIRRTSSR